MRIDPITHTVTVGYNIGVTKEERNALRLVLNKAIKFHERSAAGVGYTTAEYRFLQAFAHKVREYDDEYCCDTLDEEEVSGP